MTINARIYSNYCSLLLSSHKLWSNLSSYFLVNLRKVFSGAATTNNGNILQLRQINRRIWALKLSLDGARRRPVSTHYSFSPQRFCVCAALNSLSWQKLPYVNNRGNWHELMSHKLQLNFLWLKHSLNWQSNQKSFSHKIALKIRFFTPNDAAQSNVIAENKLRLSSSPLVKHSNEDDGKHFALFGKFLFSRRVASKFSESFLVQFSLSIPKSYD